MKEPRKPSQRIGLIANPEKANCRRLVRQAAAMIKAARRTVLADAQTASLANLQVASVPDVAALAGQCDLLMVFGGDGTILRIARETAGSHTPILGINAGGLGFLTDIPAQRMALALEQIWAGQTVLERRPLMLAQGSARGEPVSALALNDFVITRGAGPRLIELAVRVDGQVLTRFRSDGLIICSPTGSTAYSLAAGGAIIAPNAGVLALTPICPHTLSNRSVIVGLSSIIEVTVLSKRVETILTADGQPPTPLATGDTIRIRRSPHQVRLLHLAGSSFFDTLRRKLHWVGSHV